MATPTHPMDRLPSQKTRHTQDIVIGLDADAAAEYEAAQARLELLVSSGTKGPSLAEARKSFAAAKSRLDAGGTLHFRVSSLGRRAYEDLLGEHTATAEQIARAEAAGGDAPMWNEDTFPPALLSAGVVIVDGEGDSETVWPLTIEQAEELWSGDLLNSGELRQLFSAAFQINFAAKVLTMGKDSGRTPRSR